MPCREENPLFLPLRFPFNCTAYPLGWQSEARVLKIQPSSRKKTSQPENVECECECGCKSGSGSGSSCSNAEMELKRNRKWNPAQVPGVHFLVRSLCASNCAAAVPILISTHTYIYCMLLLYLSMLARVTSGGRRGSNRSRLKKKICSATCHK